MNRRAMTRQFLATAALALALALTLGGCGPGSQQSQPEAPPLAGAAIGGPFTLVDKDGRTVRWQDFSGRYRIVYFGYTFCPDACPLDLAKMMQGIARFAKAEPALAAKTQPIFITIDPARDTPKIMGEYTASFSTRLLGLTGSEAAVNQAADAFRVYHAKGAATPGGGYLMDHSRIAYLMGPRGEPISMLPVDKDADAVAAELAKWVK
jgi:protein SCO1/2